MKPEDSFVGQPVRSLQTMLRTIASDDPSVPSVIPDGVYGPATMRAVTAVQRKCGLPQTGVTDCRTWEAAADLHVSALIRAGKPAPVDILLEPGAVFHRGDRSPWLYALQSMLTVLAGEHRNLESPPHSGVLDEQTAACIAAFQALSGLPETGEPDRMTWHHLTSQFTLSASRQSRK